MKRFSLFICIQYIVARLVTGHKTALGIKVNHSSSKPDIATDVANFNDLLLEGNLFVDKSLLIKEILEDKRKIILLTRPRHWGKTININMLKTFLEVSVDEDGYLLLSNTSAPNYRLFINGEIISKSGQLEKLRNPLLISNYKNIVDQYLARCFVLFVDFSHVEGDNFVQLMDSILARLGDTIKNHDYLVSIFNETINSANVAVVRKVLVEKRLNWYYNMVNQSQSLKPVDIRDSLKFLAKILRDYFAKPVFVLIDEYDAPVISVINNDKFPKEDREKFFHFYSEFLTTTFKQNEYIKQGILTGVFPLTAEQLAVGLNVITEYTFFTGELMEFYGFTEYEIRAIYDHLEIPEDQRNSSLSYYGRYEVLNSTVQVYRPWSIARYLANNQETWFEETEIKNFLNIFLQAKRFPDIFHTLCGTLRSENIVQKSNSGPFTWQDLDDLFNLTRIRTHYLMTDVPLVQKLTLTLVDKGFAFLYTLGYLSLDNRHTNDTVIGFRFPNIEVTQPMNDIVKEYNFKVSVRYGK